MRSKSDSAPTFETERIVLRPVAASDCEDIFAYCGNPNVAKFTTWEQHRSIADSKVLIDRALKNYERGSLDPLAIILKAEGSKMVGTAGCAIVSETTRTAEIAYALAENHWGQGLVTEACHELVDHAFNALAMNRVQARCLPMNIGSARVMKKLGMKFEGRLRQSMLVKGELQDIDVWSILKSEWLS